MLFNFFCVVYVFIFVLCYLNKLICMFFYIVFYYIIIIKIKNFIIFWKLCDKVRKYYSFKSYDEYIYIIEWNFKYFGVD